MGADDQDAAEDRGGAGAGRGMARVGWTLNDSLKLLFTTTDGTLRSEATYGRQLDDNQLFSERPPRCLPATGGRFLRAAAHGSGGGAVSYIRRWRSLGPAYLHGSGTATPFMEAL